MTAPGWTRGIALFLGGQAISLFGSALVQYAIIWHLTLTTGSAIVLGGSIIAGCLPQAVVSVFGGVWADRHNRKLLIIGADGTIAATTLILAILMASGASDLWLIFATLTIRSAGAGIQTPAVGAAIPQLVPAEHLLRVNSINATVQAGILLVGPAAAAALYAGMSLTAVLAVDVITAAIGILLVSLVPLRTMRSATTAGASYFADLTAGLRYVRGHPTVRRILLLFTAVFVLAVPPSVLSPLFIADQFGPEIWKLTVNEVAYSAGLIVGGALLAWWGGLADRMRMITLAALGFGVCSILLGVAGSLPLFLAVMALTGFVEPAFSTTSQTLLQEQVEPEMHGRIFGLLGIVISLAIPFGMAVFGPLGEVVRLEAIFIGCGIATIAAGVIALRMKVAVRSAD